MGALEVIVKQNGQLHIDLRISEIKTDIRHCKADLMVLRGLLEDLKEQRLEILSRKLKQSGEKQASPATKGKQREVSRKGK